MNRIEGVFKLSQELDLSITNEQELNIAGNGLRLATSSKRRLIEQLRAEQKQEDFPKSDNWYSLAAMLVDNHTETGFAGAAEQLRALDEAIYSSAQQPIISISPIGRNDLTFLHKHRKKHLQVGLLADNPQLTINHNGDIEVPVHNLARNEFRRVNYHTFNPFDGIWVDRKFVEVFAYTQNPKMCLYPEGSNLDDSIIAVGEDAINLTLNQVDKIAYRGLSSLLRLVNSQ